MSTIKILYDARVFESGTSKDASRTGIYFTALNLLKEFTKINNIKLTLYFSEEQAKKIKKVLKQEFPDTKFDLLIYNGAKFKNFKDTIAYILTQDSNFLSVFLVSVTDFVIDLMHKLQAFTIYRKYRNYDVNFSAAFPTPDIIKYLNTKKNYIFLHDLIPILFKNYIKHVSGTDWYFKLIDSLNKNDYYFTNSEHTRKDFLKFAPQIDCNKIVNTYVGCNVAYKVEPEDLDRVKTKYNIPKDKKYLFSLCSLEPRKNLIRNVQSFMQFIKKHNIEDLVFVMGGGDWKSFIDKLNNAIKDLNTDKIIKIGYVDDEDLPVLYSGAEWFTYTSEYEGFGSPVLEAMKCGCPVITSNNSSLPEVIGDAGIKIDFNSNEQHIEAYEKYYFDENLRKENAKKGIERAKLFTWEKTVDKMLNIMIKNK